jgi:hypothetical protein
MQQQQVQSCAGWTGWLGQLCWGCERALPRSCNCFVVWPIDAHACRCMCVGDGVWSAGLLRYGVGAGVLLCSQKPLVVMFWSLCACVAAFEHLWMHMPKSDGLIIPLTLPCEVALCVTVQREAMNSICSQGQCCAAVAPGLQHAAWRQQLLCTCVFECKVQEWQHV